uniref:Uncharacterized protein n=1 Tax=viral metagenome TaxID=1070528 RepID=A0A6H1ZVG0_9ZZZZ
MAPGDVTYGGAGGAGGDAISSTDTGAGGAGGYGRYAEGPPGMVTSGAGGAGGPGAGGGVLLKCNGAWPVIISGTIDTRGGGDSETNFGSLKIFGVKGLITLDGVTINAGWNDAFGTPYNPENQIYVNPVF